MDYQKPYQVEVEATGNEVFLINSTTGEKEYKIVSVDCSQSLLQVSAVNRTDKIKIPFFRIDNEGMRSLIHNFPEYFI